MLTVRWARNMRLAWSRPGNVLLSQPAIATSLRPKIYFLRATSCKPKLISHFHSNTNDGAKKNQDDVKQTGAEEAGKENSKNGANTGGGAAAAATNGGPLPLDAEDLPPLRFEQLDNF